VSIFDRLKKRAALPVGDTGLHVRELTFREVNNVQALQDDELKTWLTLAYCLVDEHGQKAWPSGGDPAALAAQVKADAEEHVTAGILNQIMQALQRLAKPGDTEQLVKN
jgi:hypothetical protein